MAGFARKDATAPPLPTTSRNSRVSHRPSKCTLLIGLKRPPNVVYRSLYSATVAFASIEHGHTTQYFDYTHVTRPRHDTACRHSSPLSARHTRTHVVQQALGYTSLLGVVCSERRRKNRSACDPLGQGTLCTRSVRRSQNDMQQRVAGAPRNLHSSERARTSIPRPSGAVKAEAAAPTPKR